MTPFGWAGLVCATAYLALLGAKSLLAVLYVRRNPEQAERPGEVTILQPILGGDPCLEETLRSNLKAVQAEFLWLVDENDPVGRRVVESIVGPGRDRVQVLLCADCPVGWNPKTFKLQSALMAVKTDYVAVLDDDTLLDPEHLPRAVACLEHCDLYTGLPRYIAEPPFWSRLLAHFVNNNSILTYLPILAFTSPITINGMFYVMKTATLRLWGGFAPILPQLCDDFALACHIRSHGGRIYQGITSQRIRTHLSGPGAYFRQLHRWFVFANLLVRQQSFAIQVLLILLLALPPLLLWGSLLLVLSGSPFAIAALFILFLLRHGILRSLQRGLFPDPPQFSPSLSLLAELLQPVHAIHASLRTTILWRSRRIRPGMGGTVADRRDSS